MEKTKTFKVPILPKSMYFVFALLILSILLPGISNILNLRNDSLKFISLAIFASIIALFVLIIIRYYNKYHKEIFKIFENGIQYQKYQEIIELPFDKIDKIVVTDATANKKILDAYFDSNDFCEKKIMNFWYRSWFKRENCTIEWAIYIIYNGDKIIKLLKLNFSNNNNLLKELASKAKEYKIPINLEAYLKYNPKFVLNEKNHNVS